MKKLHKRLNLSLVLIVVLVVFSSFALASCNNVNITEDMYKKYENLAKDATYFNGEKKVNNFSIKGNLEDKKSVTVDLGKATKFNTIELKEKTEGVTSFNIYASNDNSNFKLIYSSDTIEDYKICFVGDIEYRYLKVEVLTATKKYNVNSIKVYNNINANKAKKVTSYFLIDRVDDTDLNAINTVTDIILFSWMRFDRYGNVNIVVPNEDGTGNLDAVTAEAMYSKNLAKLREKVAEVEQSKNRHINILPCILMPISDDKEDANKFSRELMQKDRVQTTANNVKAFIDKYGFDGVDFDYEYPYKLKEHQLFDNFLIAVKNTIGDKILSTALGAWNIKMSPKAIEALDQVQLMTYDIFDSHGYHAAFYSCMVRDLSTAISKGIPVEKINLGLPFYSRPISKAGYWGDYFRFFEDDLAVLDSNSYNTKFINSVTFTAVDSGNNTINDLEYFNGYQMIQDKTAFMIDTDVLGVMIWHMNCDIDYDNDLSLFRAINQTILGKGATLVTNR